MKLGTFDIIDNKPIVFVYELEYPKEEDFWNFDEDDIRFFDYTDYDDAIIYFEESRKEWEVKGFLLKIMAFTISPNQQVQFTEIQPPTKDKRGKAKIIKIL